MNRLPANVDASTFSGIDYDSPAAKAIVSKAMDDHPKTLMELPAVAADALAIIQPHLGRTDLLGGSHV